MTILPRCFLLFFFVFLLASTTAIAKEKEAPFKPGEKLTYELWWSFIPVGYTTLEVLPFDEVKGQKAWHFRMVSKSNSFLDVFFKVRDLIDSFTSEKIDKTLLYKQDQEEGNFKRDIIVTIDWEKNEAVFSNFGKKDEPLKILEGSVDPLSAVYYLRNKTFKVGDIIEAPVTDGKKSILGKATVMKRETVKINKTTYDTFLVEPQMTHIGGVFKKEKKAKIKVWFTTDEKHYPVRVRSKVSIGSFSGDLITIKD